MRANEAIDWRNLLNLKLFFFRLLGVFCALIAFKGFLIPNNFLDGGITGISILMYKIFQFDISLALVVLNIPFLIIGYIKIGKNFALNSAISIVLLAIALAVINIPVITTDKFLIAIFGGIFIGMGIGFVIRSGGVIDGLEVLVEYTNRKSVFSSTEIVMTINTLIFVTAAYKFGFEKAMYSIITFYTAIRTANYIVDGIEQFTKLTIVSKEYEAIKSLVVKDFNKGITVYKGERGYLPDSFDVSTPCDVIVTIVTRLEIFHIKNAILEKDPKAFMYIESLNEVSGGVVKHVGHH
jgi:uncharacterized membrane-anchored protein YitT (DUF2179 family)